MVRPTRRMQAVLIPLTLVVLAGTVLVPTSVASHEYDQGVWFNWHTMELDVLVLGTNEPIIGWAIRDAIEAWETGIQELAPDLAAQLTIRVYNPALDPVPPPGFQLNDVNIYFAPQGFMAVWTSIGPSPNTCVALAPMAVGWGSHYHVALHEFGHCLGLGHVFNHGNEYSPGFDPMGGGQSGFTSCPSNLNIMVLERVFSGQGGTVTIPSADYFQSNC